MSSGSHEQIDVEASVAGLNRFLTDARSLQSALSDVRRAIETPVEGGFGNTAAQLRQMQTAIAAIEAQRKYNTASNTYATASREALANPQDDKLNEASQKAAAEQLAAERRLTAATKAYQEATEKRAREMSAPLVAAQNLAELAAAEAQQRRISLAAAKDLGQQLRARVAADDKATADAEAQQRRIALAAAKDLGQQLRAHVAAEAQAVKDAETENRSRFKSTTRLNTADITRAVRDTIAAQNASAKAAEAEAKANEKRAADAISAAEKLGVLYRQEVAKQEQAQAEAAKRADQALSPEQIDSIASRGSRPTDTSSVGRLTSQQARQSLALSKADADLEAAMTQAATGAKTEAVMEQRLGELAQRRYQARQDLAKTEDLLASAMRKRATLEENEALSLQQSPLQRARSNFMVGFKGASDVPYLQQAGQAAKFSVLYGTAYKALFAVTQTFTASVQEGIQFQQGLSDMAVATGRPKAELKDLSERLASIATSAGSDPAAGLEIGARSVGLYSTGSQSQDQQAYVAELSTKIVSQMAMGTKVDPVTLQQNIAAVTQALGLGAGGQIRVADLDQYYSKKFGSGVGDTLEAAAQSSSVGIAAGFTPEQIQGLASVMIGRTGQSSSAVGGYLAQIFSRGGEGSLTNVAGKYGINTNQDLAGQFSDLSNVYKNADPNQQSEISAAFGRGKVQNAVVAALQSWGEVASEAKKAENGAADGSLDKAFAERIGNVGGQLELLQGDMKEFAHLFGESGLLAVLGAGIKALDMTVEALNTILGLYNELPAALRDFIAVLVTGAAIGKFTGAGSLAKDAMNGVIPIGLARRTGQLAGAPGVSNVLNDAGEVTAVRVGSQGLAAAGKAALKTIGPWAVAGAGLLAIADVAKVMKENAALQRNTITALNQDPGYNADAGSLRNYASQLSTAAAADRTSGDWFTQAVTFGRGNDDSMDNAKALETEAKRIRALAKDVEDHTAKVIPKTITGLDSASIAAGLDQITNNGGTATQRINALANAINGLSDSAAKTSTKIDPNKLATVLADSTRKISLDRQNFTNDGTIGIDWASLDPANPESKDAVAKMRAGLNKALSPSDIAKRLPGAMAAAGVDSFTQINAGNAGEIADSISSLPRSLTKKYAGLQELVAKQMRDALLKQAADIKDATRGTSMLSSQEVVGTLTSLQTETSNRMQARGDNDFGGKISDAKRYVELVKRTRSRSEDQNLPVLIEAINSSETLLGQQQIARLEALRKAAVANSKSAGEARATGLGFVRQEIAVAVRTGDTDLLVQVVEGAGKEAIGIARKAIADALKVARAARKNAAAIEQAASAGAVRKAGGNQDATQVTPSATDSSKPSNRERRLGRQLKGLDTAISDADPDSPTNDSAAQINAARAAAQAARGGGGAVASARAALVAARADLEDQKGKEGTVAYFQALAGVYSAQRDLSAAIGATHPAQLQAQAARLGGQIAPARAAIASAKADLAQTTKGTTEYYQALASLFDARQQLSDALLAYGRNVRSLRIDATDPVATARLDLQEARRKLRMDAGKGKDVKAEDKVAVRDSANALESAAFSQRLSDVQTADQLGRISHSAYLRYLQNEHERLSAISKRTRQQQDELNQIDGLMLEAKKELQGAWNIGDIQLPTPYEVRKYVKEQAGLGATSQSTVRSSTTVYIDGADTGAVKKIIADTVGKNARVLTTTPRRN
jgi:hypothetical protein